MPDRWKWVEKHLRMLVLARVARVGSISDAPCANAGERPHRGSPARQILDPRGRWRRRMTLRPCALRAEANIQRRPPSVRSWPKPEQPLRNAQRQQADVRSWLLRPAALHLKQSSRDISRVPSVRRIPSGTKSSLAVVC
jgi:hypothetical protein